MGRGGEKEEEEERKREADEGEGEGEGGFEGREIIRLRVALLFLHGESFRTTNWYSSTYTAVESICATHYKRTNRLKSNGFTPHPSFALAPMSHPPTTHPYTML